MTLDSEPSPDPEAGEPEFCGLADHVVKSTSASPPGQWPVMQYGLKEVWTRFGTKGEGARVAVIDTGVNTKHPALAKVFAHDLTGDGVVDAQGHGTHCCGIVGSAESAPVIGVAPGCELHSFRVFNNRGVCRNEWIVAALREITSGKHGRFHVVSMSLGSEQPSESMRMLLLEMMARGYLIVAASGNDGSHDLQPRRRFGTVGFPAAFVSTIAVGSTNKARKRSSYSSTGNKMVVTGPGEDITGCWVGGGKGDYATISGTSMACPFVAGCLALLVSYAAARGLPAPRLDTVLYCIGVSAVDLETAGYDDYTGFGDIHPEKLILAYDRLARSLSAGKF